MGIYSLTILSLGVLVIGLVFVRHDIARPRVLSFLLLAVAVYVALFYSLHHQVQKTCLIVAGDSIADIRALIQSWGVAAPLMSIFLMTLQAVVAPLPAFLITATNGLVFGMYWGTAISWIGAMSGALVSFFIARLFVESFARKLRGTQKGVEYINRLSTAHGFKVVLVARLLPFISFDLISYAAGLSRMKTRSFVLATGLGMLPATVVYTVFGAEMERLNQLSDRYFTFTILAVLALVLVWTLQSFRKRKS